MNATIAEVGRAPGKSIRADADVEALQIDHRGLFGDREYMWVEVLPHEMERYHRGELALPGQFLSQREDPQLTGIVPEMTEDGILLTWQRENGLFVPKADDTVENRIPASVWGWSGEAVDQGDLAAMWGEKHIGRPVRLVAISDEAPRYVEGDPALGRVGFADGYPITVASTTSIWMINKYLESKGYPRMPNDRARANIILDGISVEDPEAFPEDYIESITIASNGLTLVLERYKACMRCPIPNTNQVTGERRGHVLKALVNLGRSGQHVNTEKYGTKKKPIFTQNFIIKLPPGMKAGQVISIERGAEAEVTYSEDTNWVKAA